MLKETPENPSLSSLCSLHDLLKSLSSVWAVVQQKVLIHMDPYVHDADTGKSCGQEVMKMRMKTEDNELNSNCHHVSDSADKDR